MSNNNESKRTMKRKRKQAKTMEKKNKRRKKSSRRASRCKPTPKTQTSSSVLQSKGSNPCLDNSKDKLVTKPANSNWTNCIKWGDEKDPLKTIKEAQVRHLKYSKKTRTATKAALDKLQSEDYLADSIKRILSLKKFGGVSRASDITYRYRQGKYGIRTVYTAIKKHVLGKTDFKVWFITIIGDNMLSSELRPELDVYSITIAIAKLIRDTPGISAFGVLEIQPCHNHSITGGTDATFMGNFHLVAYGPKFEKEEFRKRVEGKFKSTLAKPVDIKEVGATKNDALRAASYLFKIPNKSKSRIVTIEDGVEKARHDRERPIRADLHLRTLDILSRIPARSLMIGVGDGLKVKRKILAKMREFERKNRVNADEKISYDDVPEIWSDFWERTKRTDYEEPKIRVSRKKGGKDA